MFWYTKKCAIKTTAAGLLSLAAVVSSCTSATDQEKKKIDPEFDIPSFFENEIRLLNASKPKVTKTVHKDSISETKQLNIADWEKELANFTSIDLNKPAYQGTYSKDSVGNSVTYTFQDPSVDLSVVKIVYENGAPAVFSIKRANKNLLYDTEEQLEYIKNKSYSVDKTQTVKLLGSQHYHIQGVIDKQ